VGKAARPSGQKCSDSLLPLEELQARGRRSNMDQFVRAQNVERYRKLLDCVTEESERQQITKLLIEERQKQKEARDPLR
jgi:hypothetical protein